MLNTFKQHFTNNHIQFILVDHQGTIMASDDSLWTLEKETSLFAAHPFFESFRGLEAETNEELNFNCVHLEIAGKTCISDIKLVSKKEGIFLVIYDLTEHYNSYQEVAQARNESVINQELIVLKNLELQERERFKNKFIQNFSHELRNPLTSVMAITNVLADTDLTNEQQQMLQFLQESNAHLKLMLEDVLSISTIASGKLKLEHKLFNVHRLFELLKFTYTTKAKSKDLKFKCKIDKRIPENVEGDRLRIFQVLTNLLDNALKYTDEGHIGLEVNFNQKRANKVSVEFRVTDTGIGIPEEKATAIFESFSQLDTPNKEGTGLGLSIVKGLLELMESEIKINSIVGKGSSFSFNLLLPFPLHSETEELISKDIFKRSKGTSGNSEKFKVLLVEDDARVQTALFKVLMETNRFYLNLVNDGAHVMEEIINENYDLLLMDINLPNTRGDQLTRLIREFPFKNIQDIPIIGITANAFKEDLEAYKKAGMNEVLSKPFDMEELLETVFHVLKQQKQSAKS